MPTETCSPLLTYFPFMCLRHASCLPQQPQVFLEAASAPCPEPCGNTCALHMGQAPGYQENILHFNDRSGFRVIQPAWAFPRSWCSIICLWSIPSGLFLHPFQMAAFPRRPEGRQHPLAGEHRGLTHKMGLLRQWLIISSFPASIILMQQDQQSPRT